MDMERDTNTDDELELPAALIDALQAEDRAEPVITARTDRALKARAAAHFAARQPDGRSWHSAWYAAAAVAAVALLVVVPAQRLLDDQAPAGAVYADVDASGRIDIADVLLLAREGRASQSDIDAFAARIVSLGQVGDAR